MNPTRVSVVSCGTEMIDGDSFQPVLSSDGVRIGFATEAENLLPGDPCPDTNGRRDIVIRDVAEGVTRRFSVASDGTPGNGSSSNPDLSGDGRVAVYVSEATNLLGPPPGDGNGLQDVFQTPSPQGPFIRGDANHDGTINLSDGVYIQNWLYRGGPPPPCYDAADANDDDKIDLTDSTDIWDYLFRGGLPPPCPYSCSPTTSCCGNDPTGDGLPCGQALGGCTEFVPPDGSCPRCP